jgi:hypothetical protein
MPQQSNTLCRSSAPLGALLLLLLGLLRRGCSAAVSGEGTGRRLECLWGLVGSRWSASGRRNSGIEAGGHII